MTDEVGRTRGDRESRAHGSARRELVNVDKIPSQAKGKQVVVAGSTQAQDEEAQDEYEEQMEVTNEPGLEEQQQQEDDLSDFFDFGDEEEEEEEDQQCKTRYLRCMNNGKKINDFTLPKSDLHWFWNVVKASGLRPLLKTNYNNLDWGLLTAFTERWHPETGTFHLPIGAVTITLDDVSCLLHIPITGKMLNHLGTSCTTEEGEDMCREYLNFPRTKCRTEFKKMKGLKRLLPVGGWWRPTAEAPLSTAVPVTRAPSLDARKSLIAAVKLEPRHAGCRWFGVIDHRSSTITF
ncbi:hypothetical protein TSUD_89700 [Trifolium subterraneum]|uniref:Aminotransferase-like plant mobile domain-containing protein n=1 Tax=Trifolium subterraneum TaxID=3900 RepID=A0A2Z6N8S3_TRISU|nr:hypothetical protein TSUD_89700 [Trifolium subterraneum]